jgi:hypothetical protein
MKTKLMALILMAGGTLFAETHVAIGVQFGRPAPVVVRAPVVVNAYRPPYPGPGYVWIEGYYDEFNNWYDGYWALPPYAGAYWVAPRFNGGHFATGYWGGARGVYRVEPRYAPPAYNRGNGRTFDRPAGGRSEHGFRERGRGPDQGTGRTGESRQGFRR